ncbi:MAG: RNA polymerase sigma factor [Hyphomicrobiaceae bacterium]|nr:RNA polymerase sigma factor [Hyphomicrobiaceae bacterium]
MIEFLPRLRRFAYALTRNLEQADDLVQDTCERALARADQWQPGTRLDSWMYRIAQNIWFDSKRAAKVRGERADLEDIAEISGSDGRTVVENRLTLASVFKEMDRLPRDQQVLVALVCIDGLSYKEAAETLQLPIGTVMSRLSRARQAIANALMETNPALAAANSGARLGKTS